MVGNIIVTENYNLRYNTQVRSPSVNNISMVDSSNTKCIFIENITLSIIEIFSGETPCKSSNILNL